MAAFKATFVYKLKWPEKYIFSYESVIKCVQNWVQLGTNSTTWIKRWAIKKRELSCLPKKRKKHKINCFLNYTKHGVKKRGRKNFSQKFLSWFLHKTVFTSGCYYTPFFLFVSAQLIRSGNTSLYILIMFYTIGMENKNCHNFY